MLLKPIQIFLLLPVIHRGHHINKDVYPVGGPVQLNGYFLEKLPTFFCFWLETNWKINVQNRQLAFKPDIFKKKLHVLKRFTVRPIARLIRKNKEILYRIKWLSVKLHGKLFPDFCAVWPACHLKATSLDKLLGSTRLGEARRNRSGCIIFGLRSIWVQLNSQMLSQAYMEVVCWIGARKYTIL